VNFLDAWSPGVDRGSLLLSGELTAGAPPSSRPIGRRARRVPVELDAGLRRRGMTRAAVQVLDLSVDGFRAGTTLDLVEGEEVWLRLPGLEGFPARVVWAANRQVGCAFLRSLHPAVHEMIIAAAKR
jgi:hypothetical protein